MKILITTFGSTGDIVPFVALAEGLRVLGHEITFVVPASIQDHSEKKGFKTVQLGSEYSDEYLLFQQKLSEGRLDETDIQLRNSLLAEQASDSIKILRTIARQSDLMIRLHRMPFAPLVAKLAKVPEVILRVGYPGLESVEENHSTSSDTSSVVHVPDELDAKQLCLYAISRQLLVQNSAWPENNYVVGSMSLRDDPASPPSEMTNFLRRHKSVVGVTLGSTVHSDPERLFDLFCDVILDCGCAGIIQQGWSNLGRDRVSPDGILALDYTPHEHLFPHLSCVIHHAGAGTTATAMKYAVPSVCIPHFSDQFRLSRELSSLGMVGDIVPYKELNRDRLKRAIEHCLNDPEIKMKATETRERFAEENGVERAIDRILEFTSHLNLTPETA